MKRNLIAAAVAAVAALAPATAAAAPVALGGGTTTVGIDQAALDAFDSLGVAVTPTKPAVVSSNGIDFPVTGGALDGTTGVVRHSGGLRFKQGKRAIKLSDYNVKLRDRSTITAKVNGGPRLTVFELDLSEATIDDSGIGVTVSGVGVDLTRKAAKALNTLFRTNALSGGFNVGGATVAVTPRFLLFTGGQTDLALDPGAAAALQSQGITPGLTQGATANSDGSFAFPITRGRVNATTLAGTVDHSGGITLTKGSTVVTLTDFLIDTTAATLSARVNGGADRVAIIALDLSAPQVTIDGGTVNVGNVIARLNHTGAAALNQAFSTNAFTDGLTLGVATVRGETS